METRIQCVVAGAGVVGLACARLLALSGIEVAVLEKHNVRCNETSSRNSEVIHAGIYYPQNSLKAKLCVQGRHALYDYLNRHALPHSQCGKLIVCTDIADLPRLKLIQQHAHDNGVQDLRMLSKTELNAYEHRVVCEYALLSPSTGILDSHSYAEHLQLEAEQAGAIHVYNCEIQSLQRTTIGSGGWKLETTHGPIACDYFINSAGLYAPFLAYHINEYPKV